MRSYCFLACLVCGLWSTWLDQARAAEQTITAVFSPNPGKPSHASFLNLTPNSGVCRWRPLLCKDNQNSLDVPITFESAQGLSMAANAMDSRQGALFKMPSEFRTVAVTHVDSGETAELKFRFVGFGADYRSSTPIGWEAEHSALWKGGSWLYAPSPCRSTFNASASSYLYEFFWYLPPSDQVCAKQVLRDYPGPFSYGNFTYIYELQTPNPLAMGRGRYTGSVTFTVGPGQDLDFGDVMLPSDNLLTVNFDLAVNHLFKVDFPPGSNRVVLQPKSGWQHWLNGGKVPALTASQDFTFSSSGKINIYLDCQYPSGTTCAIQDDAGQSQVPVDIAITMPFGIVTYYDRFPVNRLPLAIGHVNRLRLQTVAVQFDRRARLHYDVTAAATQAMADQAGQTFRGNATIIFDADL